MDGTAGHGANLYIYQYYNSYWYQLSEALEMVHANNNGTGSSIIGEPVVLGNNDSSFASMLIGANDGVTLNKVRVHDLSAGEAPYFTSSATFSADENQTSIGTVNAADLDTKSLSFSTSSSDVSITSAGVLTFISAPDYETKTSYTETIRVSDGINSTSQEVTINITNQNDNAPVFTSAASFSAAENQTAIGTVTAIDADDDSVTFTISG